MKWNSFVILSVFTAAQVSPAHAQQPDKAVQIKVPPESLRMAVKDAPATKKISTAAITKLPTTISLIREADLKRDLYFLASDAMRGREAGTLDELRASGWIAQQLQSMGLEPAGDDGTYFQWWPMRRSRVGSSSIIAIGDAPLSLWREVIVNAPTDITVDLPMVWVGEGRDADLQGIDLAGKAAVAQIVAPTNRPAANMSLRSFRYARAAINEQSRRLLQRGAAAVVLVADDTTESAMEFLAVVSPRGSYGLDSAGVDQRPRSTPPVLIVHRGMAERVRAPGQRLNARLRTESFVYPSVNIVARVRGTDKAKRDEYVLFSGHQDHDGVRFPVDGDSIWNGADDNATTSVAMLAIARAWKKQPGKRSALFVWHGAEERGLLGSRWYSAHPTVPLNSIVAVLNGDMLGHNNPDSASILGVQPPHRNSNDLVAIAMRANDLTGKFKLDSIWDRPTHPEGWYFRSDHLPYARLNIPSLFYSTNLHPDYHTPRDEASTINYPKLTRMTKWMYATGWLVANSDARPKVDEGFKLER